METKLIAKLKAKQGELNWTDGQMAARLGVSRQAWNHIKTGRRHIGMKLLQGIMAGFPELTTACLIFLDENATRLADSANRVVEIAPDPLHVA